MEEEKIINDGVSFEIIEEIPESEIVPIKPQEHTLEELNGEVLE